MPDKTQSKNLVELLFGHSVSILLIKWELIIKFLLLLLSLQKQKPSLQEMTPHLWYCCVFGYVVSTVFYFSLFIIGIQVY